MSVRKRKYEDDIPGDADEPLSKDSHEGVVPVTSDEATTLLSITPNRSGRRINHAENPAVIQKRMKGQRFIDPSKYLILPSSASCDRCKQLDFLCALSLPNSLLFEGGRPRGYRGKCGTCEHGKCSFSSGSSPRDRGPALQRDQWCESWLEAIGSSEGGDRSATLDVFGEFLAVGSKVFGKRWRFEMEANPLVRRGRPVGTALVEPLTSVTLVERKSNDLDNTIPSSATKASHLGYTPESPNPKPLPSPPHQPFIHNSISASSRQQLPHRHHLTPETMTCSATLPHSHQHNPSSPISPNISVRPILRIRARAAVSGLTSSLSPLDIYDQVVEEDSTPPLAAILIMIPSLPPNDTDIISHPLTVSHYIALRSTTQDYSEPILNFFLDYLGSRHRSSTLRHVLWILPVLSQEESIGRLAPETHLTISNSATEMPAGDVAPTDISSTPLTHYIVTTWYAPPQGKRKVNLWGLVLLEVTTSSSTATNLRAWMVPPRKRHRLPDTTLRDVFEQILNSPKTRQILGRGPLPSDTYTLRWFPKATHTGPLVIHSMISMLLALDHTKPSDILEKLLDENFLSPDDNQATSHSANDKGLEPKRIKIKADPGAVAFNLRLRQASMITRDVQMVQALRLDEFEEDPDD